jgi:hypothetical protein
VELGTERRLERDSDVINGWLRVTMESLIDTDCVGKLDRSEWDKVGDDSVRNVRNIPSVALEDLESISVRNPQKE